MPIRTHRGRAAVYRRLWGWPLRSPKHLLGALVVAAGAATVVGLLLPEPPPTSTVADGGTQTSITLPPQRSAVVEDPPSPPTISVPDTPPKEVAPDPAGVEIAEKWGDAWVNHPPGTDKQQWLSGLKPYTTDEFYTVMSTVDPANAGNAVTGVPMAVGPASPGVMQVKLPTDVGTLRVTLNKTEAGWRVAEYNKEG
ncbi:hypothetical protein GCM10009854_28270 [Saccharopolyspora halophila]|uniref:Uncharacterized protein n=1 Tax=Saccharopolyspora halophila TaxID=405551 RepID=A0ABN3GDN4_9PSEU